MASKSELLRAISEQLERAGIPLQSLGTLGPGEEGLGDEVRVLCLGGTLSDSLDTLSGSPRDQVVMARLHQDAVEQLDAWVETGALRSRSEAAALFIQEGLALRASELNELRGALDEVREAKGRLKEIAEKVLGSGGDDEAR